MQLRAWTAIWFGLALTEALASPAVVKTGETIVVSGANVLLDGLSFQQDALASFNGWQYAAYYKDAGTVRHVALARRPLPDGDWERLEFTDYQQTINDAHNVISLGISPLDGTIHLSFDAHAGPLHYRKSVTDLATSPESHSWDPSEFGPVEDNLGGIRLSSITYPRFLIAPDGKLQYEVRIGTSGNGDSYLYEYDGANGVWAEIGKYIDGRSSHVNAYLNGIQYDAYGRLHATWCWRETPDPITNHDLLYAYSDDRGRTWYNNAGDMVAITGQTFMQVSTPGLVVWPIGQRQGLLNQEAQTVDSQGRVHALMRDSLSGSLRYVHYYRAPDGTWSRNVLPPVAPTERGKIVTDAEDNAYAQLPNLLIAAASSASGYTDWTIVDREDQGRFSSEPLIDSARILQDGTLSTFHVAASGDIYVLDFQFTNCRGFADSVIEVMRRASDWQIAHLPGGEPRDWIHSVFWAGLIAAYQTTGESAYVDCAVAWAQANQWMLGPRLRHADDQCAGQSYLELYQLDPQPERLVPTQETLDLMVHDPHPGRVDWWWCDALFMAPAVFARLGALTGDPAYADLMSAMWWDTTDFLFDPAESLFYRDASFFDRRCPNGEKMFWSRGNAWVIAGIVRVLQYLPADHPDRGRFIGLLQSMAQRVALLQKPDGYWPSCLTDPENFPWPETSGTAGFIYALAWGINEGILDADQYSSTVLNGWTALIQAINQDGKLGWVQLPGSQPAISHEEDTQPYGVGLFLLAGSEVFRFASNWSRAAR